jgi:peptidoglycan-N-acetylglucosamine deacetylase
MIDRRTALVSGIAAAITARAGPAIARADRPKIAITLDDFRPFETGQMSRPERNERILAALKAHKVKAAGFPIAGAVADAEGSTILDAWGGAGHMIGNHSYSHPDYAQAGLAAFAQDVLKADEALRGRTMFRKRLRFPYLSEGKTAEARDSIRSFLAEHGYRNASVTIDTSDWYIDGRMRARLATSPDADAAPYGRFFLEHVWDRARFYNNLLAAVTGRPGPHTILLHHNELNARFLGQALAMFARRGWLLVDAEDVLYDPLFARQPKSLPAGQSLAWALAKESGRFERKLRFPGEDGEYEKPKMDMLGL